MIGKRIRCIRKKRNMTMKYLGMAVGLPESSADIRISQYESSQRTPKAKLLSKIAEQLGVSLYALLTPELNTVAGVMHTLFIMEDLYGFEIKIINRTSDELDNAINEWQDQHNKFVGGEISKEEYDNWRYNYRYLQLIIY